MSQAEMKDKKLIEEVWGDCCLECDCKDLPNLRYYKLKNEDIAILACSKCDFTIVVVELDRLYDKELEEDLESPKNSLLATYGSF